MKKKIFVVAAMLFSLVTLVSCMNNSKTFSKIGVTIELDKSFVEKDVIQAPFYLESTKYIFTGIRESKEEIDAAIGVINLRDYIDAVLENNQKEADVLEYDEDDLKYYYAYYTAVVGDQEFGYMLFVMEGEKDFYSFNFGTLANNFDKSKDQFNKWIKTITVK